jgi:hypothetical protein
MKGIVVKAIKRPRKEGWLEGTAPGPIAAWDSPLQTVESTVVKTGPLLVHRPERLRGAYPERFAQGSDFQRRR